MLETLLHRIGNEHVCASERVKIYEASFDFCKNNKPSYTYFENIIKAIPLRDSIQIVLQDENESICQFNRERISQELYDSFLEKVLDDEIISCKIEVTKTLKDNFFSIYNYQKFAEDILQLTIEKSIKAFSELLREVSEKIIFEMFDESPMFATKTLFFIPTGNTVESSQFSRKERIDKCKDVSYFYNFDIYEVLPDDFKIEINYRNNPLTALFQKIEMLLAISFIASSSSLNGNVIHGKIHGQRTVEYNSSVDNVSYNGTLYKIYNWIYTEGSAIDKSIIARNIISLHCKYIPITEIDEKVLASIQSNFNLYLKDNVMQYLELKNKVAEFIIEIVAKTGEYATDILEKFKTNLIAVFGFLFTVILANIVSEQPLNNIFTRDVTIIMECVLFGSVVYLIICYVQSQYQMKKVYNSYEQIKKNYNEILTEEDLAEIFENDKMMKEMKKSIKKSEKIYLAIWIIFLLVSLIILECVSTEPFPVMKRVSSLLKENEVSTFLSTIKKVIFK